MNFTRLALATWIAANICLQFSLAPAARLWGATGALLVAAAVIWVCYTPSLRSFHPIFRYGDTDLHLRLGVSFWCCVAAGDFTGKKKHDFIRPLRPEDQSAEARKHVSG